MPKVGARASTPETPRINRDTLRRAVLYNSNPMGTFLKPKLTVSQDDDEAMARKSSKGIPFASEKPSAQQIAERDRGFVQSAPNITEQKGWNVGYINKSTTYSTEPQNLLRYGYAGAQQLQRKRLDKRIIVTEWTPKLEGKPSVSAAPNMQSSPGLWPEIAAHPTGASVLTKSQTQSTYLRESALGSSSNLNDPLLANSSKNINSLQSLERLSRTIERERDAETKFKLQLSVEKKSKAISNKREDADVLSQGLGPEARMKVFRNADKQKEQELKTSSLLSTSSSSMKKKNKNKSSSSLQGRVMIPKTERRRPRYCGGLTVCVETKAGSDFNIGDMARAAASSELQSTQAKWQMIGRFHAKWFQSYANKQQFSYASLQSVLSAATAKNPDSSRISREQFISSTMLRLRDMNLAHRLYAALAAQLDQNNHDSVPCLDILLPLVMLATAQAGKPQAEVLLAGLKLYEMTSPPLTYANVMTVFQTSASTRLEKLELISRASGGFDFALRAAASAAEMASSVGGGGGGGGGLGGRSGVSPNRTQAYEMESFEDGPFHPSSSTGFDNSGNVKMNNGSGFMSNSGYDQSTNAYEDEHLLNVGGGGVQTGLSPELVLDVLSEFPDLAGDINRQMNARFLAAGRAVASLAVLESSEIKKKNAEKQALDARKSMTTSSRGNDNRGGSSSHSNRASSPPGDSNGKLIKHWVDVGIKAGDARKATFLLPTYDESDSEEEESLQVKGV